MTDSRMSWADLNKYMELKYISYKLNYPWRLRILKTRLSNITKNLINLKNKGNSMFNIFPFN